MRTLVKNFRISPQGILQVTKTAKMGTFEGVFVFRLHLKRHNFGQWESFRDPVDIPRMYLAWVSFGGGCTVWALWAHENNKFRQSASDLTSRFNVTRQGATHVLMYWSIQNVSSTAASVFNKLTYLLTCNLFEPILQCVPRYTATRLVIIMHQWQHESTVRIWKL